jgi:hypothetical protein
MGQIPPGVALRAGSWKGTSSLGLLFMISHCVALQPFI